MGNAKELLTSVAHQTRSLSQTFDMMNTPPDGPASPSSPINGGFNEPYSPSKSSVKAAKASKNTSGNTALFSVYLHSARGLPRKFPRDGITVSIEVEGGRDQGIRRSKPGE